jgi:hypothetical protein
MTTRTWYYVILSIAILGFALATAGVVMGAR